MHFILFLLCNSLQAQVPISQEIAAKPEVFRVVSIDNVAPRRDVADEIIDAHDGCLQIFDDNYYLYGTAYGQSAGFGINNRYRVYRSPDLEHWHFEGELLKEPPRGVFYRPYVVYNPHTKKYVMWFNWYPQLWEGQIGVAVSDSPVGPFTITNLDVKLSQAGKQPGDGSLFVDDDGTGYFIYSVIGQDHAIRIERLTPDFLSSTGEVSDILAHNCEAPAMFRRGKIYYALFGTCCCFCPEGSGVQVHTATSPLGPYTFRGNINRDSQGQPIVKAQQTFVAQVPTAQGKAYLWMGDRWGSRNDDVKGHDLQYWSPPLQFGPQGEIAKLKHVEQWQTEVPIGKDLAPTADPYVWPKILDPSPLKVDPCTQEPIPPEAWDTGKQP